MAKRKEVTMSLSDQDCYVSFSPAANKYERAMVIVFDGSGRSGCYLSEPEAIELARAIFKRFKVKP